MLSTRDKDDEDVEIVVDDDIDDTDVEVTEATTEGNVARRLSTTTTICAEVQASFEDHFEDPTSVEDELRSAGREDFIGMVRARTGAEPAGAAPVPEGASSRASSRDARQQASLVSDGATAVASSSSTGGPLDGGARNVVYDILKRAEARQEQHDALVRQLLSRLDSHASAPEPAAASVATQAAPASDGGFGSDLAEVYELQQAGALSEEEALRASDWIVESVAPPSLLRDLKAVFALYKKQRNELIFAKAKARILKPLEKDS